VAEHEDHPKGFWAATGTQRTLKSLLAGFLPSAGTALITSYLHQTHWVIVAIVGVGVVCGGGFWIVDAVEERERRDELVEELTEQLGDQLEKSARIEATNVVFAQTVRTLTDEIHKQIAVKKPDLRQILSLTIDAALEDICLVANPGGPQEQLRVRAAYLSPIPSEPRHLKILAWRNRSNEPPSVLNHRFELGDGKCAPEHVTTAGYTWHEFTRQGVNRRHFMIPSVPKHLRETEGRPGDRKFAVLQGEQAERIKSILCIVLYYQPNQPADRSPEFYGILSIDSDVEGYFTTDLYNHFLHEELRPFVRLMTLACKTGVGFGV